MSVPESQRGESKFEVILKARELAAYTIQICTNEKVFLPKYQNALTNDIIREAKDVFIKCFAANNIKVGKNKEGYAERRRLQEEAHTGCNSLLALIQIAQQVYHLRLSRVNYWGSKTIEVRNLIQRWKDSDRKRYS